VIQRLTLRCVMGHEQHLDLIEEDHAFAVGLAGLMDGTSPHYRHAPHEEEVTQIGRCQWPVRGRGLFGRLRAPEPCGMQFTCTVTTIEDAP
jgi:hypothetical protein